MGLPASGLRDGANAHATLGTPSGASQRTLDGRVRVHRRDYSRDGGGCCHHVGGRFSPTTDDRVRGRERMAGQKKFDPNDALDAAIQVFWQKGYSATGIADLVAATGLSRGSIYATFGDKNTFFLASLERYVKTVGAPARDALIGDDEIGAKVKAGFDAILTRLADPNTPPGCLLAQTAAESGALDVVIQKRVNELIREQITEMQSVVSGGRGSERVESVATYLVSVAQAVAVMHRAGISVTDLRNMCDIAIQVLDQELAA